MKKIVFVCLGNICLRPNPSNKVSSDQEGKRHDQQDHKD